MLDIVVIRGLGTVDGGEITSPLLNPAALSVALTRGQQEIDGRARARRATLRTLFRAGVRRGQIAEVADSLQGPVWRGVIKGISHTVEDAVTYSTLDVERTL